MPQWPPQATAQHPHFRRVAGHEEAGFFLRLLARLAPSIDHADRARARPTQQRGLVDRRFDHVDFAALAATMRLLDGDVPAKPSDAIVGFAILDEPVEQGVMQRLLIAFDH